MRILRSAGCGVVLGLLASAALVAPIPAASAKPLLCLVVNPSAHATYTSFQTAVGNASAGATLLLRGTCTGTTVITQNLRIVGQPHQGFTAPTLNGAGQGTVLTIYPGVSVVVSRVTIEGGKTGFNGGGIWNDQGTVHLLNVTVAGNTAGDAGGGIFSIGQLTIDGASVIIDNSAEEGAGIITDGVATLNGSVRVCDNSTKDQPPNGGFGGGITNTEGTLVLNGNVSICNNIGYIGGGIYNQSGILTLNGTTAIRGNTAFDYGGGIYTYFAGGNAPAIVTMNDSAIIQGNNAGLNGGGIYRQSGTLVGAIAGTNVLGNTPNNIFP